MNNIKKFTYALLLLVSILSCESDNESNSGKYYFEGLDALSIDDTEKAMHSFSKGSEALSSTNALLSAEKLIPLLYNDAQYEKVISITKDLLFDDNEISNGYYQIDKNFLYRYMLSAMIHSNVNEVGDNLIEWLTSNSFSSEHYSFFTSSAYSDYKRHARFPQGIEEQVTVQKAVFERDYGLAVRSVKNFEAFDQNNPSLLFENLDALYLSDLGKAFLYGSSDSISYARAFDLAALSYAEKSDEAFMCYFYAGRLYEDSGRTNNAIESFEKAMAASTNEGHYDNALWYYLSATRKISSRSAISALEEFASTWNSAEYFDDFLETLAFQLLDNENYKGFYALYEFLNPYMSPVSVSKYAYISAQLIENDYVIVDAEKEHIVRDIYENAYNAQGGSLYYRMMASIEVGISSSKVIDDLLKRELEKEQHIDKDFENLLKELIAREKNSEAYSLYIKNSELVSLDAAVFLAQELSFVNSPSVENNYNKNYYPESLRLASRAFSETGNDITEEEMKLLYPRYYTDFVQQSSQEYGLSEYLIYAIMRSESFFDHDVMSWAGAIGLTQLMPTTASDVARKLRVKEYDLHDSRQNIDFGMFYFDELIPREGVDNSVLRALFSYNAGITNVRRWNRQFPELKDSPTLFLEKIPFAETREYGRKILSAGVMYGVLYYDMEVSDVVQAIMN